jgi:small acid-soluble spore protein A (major alpha-type SASP)
MARGSNTGNRALVQGAQKALDQFKYETAHELGLDGVEDGYWGEIPSRQCGAVGGQMVRKMIEMAEQNLAGRSSR